MGGHGKWLPENGKTYTITINPNDKNQGYDLDPKYYNGGSTRLLHVAFFLKKMLGEHVRQYADYKVVVEVSTPKTTIPGKEARVHCHGIITFKNAGLFYSEAQPFICRNATMEIDDIIDEGWQDYILKQKQMIEKNLPRAYYVIDSTDVATQAGLVGANIVDMLARKPTARPGGGSRGTR